MLQIVLIVGVLCGASWTTRTALKKYHIASFWMVIEGRFWRSLLINFVAAFLVSSLLASLLAIVVWLLLRLVSVLQ
jgi:hypothetical protein